MQPSERSEPAILQIDVLREDQGPLQSGTFKQPYPFVRVRRGTNVQWQLTKTDDRDTFIVSFSNGSPFEGITAISDRTGPLPAVHIGSFHYQVFVAEATSGRVYAVHHCPQMHVDNG
jgi:hypothetical protein